MKLLLPITLLVLGVLAGPDPADAQSTGTTDGQKLADFARSERIRRSLSSGKGKVYTNADFGPAPLAAAASATETTKPHQEQAVETKPTVAPGKDTADLQKEWSAEVDKLQGQLQKLKDQKTSLRNELNAIKTKHGSPVTSPSAQQEASAKEFDVQKRLDANEKELTETQSKYDKLAVKLPK